MDFQRVHMIKTYKNWYCSYNCTWYWFRSALKWNELISDDTCKFPANAFCLSLTFLFFQKIFTAWKVSKYGVFSGSYFTVVSPNAGKYGPEKTIFGNLSPSDYWVVLYVQCFFCFIFFSGQCIIINWQRPWLNVIFVSSLSIVT